jgi:plasmid maintenance system antidote protein VapI
MKLAFEQYKGIHPGLILEHELKKRGIVKRQFAHSVNEHPQTFQAITKGQRKLPLELSFRIDDALNLEQGTMLFMQTFYEIAEHNKRHELFKPILLNRLRQGLFWDTDINQIDWNKQSNAIIRRVYERGNEEEQQAIREYYGDRVVKKALS